MLSYSTKALWAKKSKGLLNDKWLPLIIHMSDAAATARLVWRDWLPSGTKLKIALGLSEQQGTAADFEDAALPCFVFLAAAHDLGKATPAFQGRLGNTNFDEQLRQQLIDASLPLSNNIHPREARHFWASQLILECYGFPRKLAVILGSHHGQPPSYDQLDSLGTAYQKDLGWKKGQEAWVNVQRELLKYALKLAGISEQKAQSWQPDITAQVLLSGLIIMTDWIASNENSFPYIDLPGGSWPSASRAIDAWEQLSLPECWSPDNAWMGESFFEERFNYEPRPVQSTMLELLRETPRPGIVIIEAPMGEGKTEAALAAAELMANLTKRSGVFFALPTQASANGLFLRFCNWIERLEDDVKHTIRLAHGKANLNELYNKIPKTSEEPGGFWVGGEEGEETGDDAIIVHEWFSGRKKGILADFVIGTIDQVLMGALKQKHLALRHLGLANKVVILDECHAYDAYMSQYLYKILNWLGAYNVPVIVLSATLPGEKRMQLIEAYLNKECAPMPDYDPVFDTEKPDPPPLPPWATTYDYPIITYTNGSYISAVRQKRVCGKQRPLNVKLTVLATDDELVPVLTALLAEGGCAGIIVNTVKRAQNISSMLKETLGENVELLHSRFIAKDRAQKEKCLLENLGPDGSKTGKRPQKCIVVGTQVFEQSCDLDFDVLITDICPMDLLIQRIGRLHRHERSRPPQLNHAQCYITGMNDSGFDRGAEIIYGKYLLMNTKKLLPPQLTLPNDIPDLVQHAYHPEGLTMIPELQEEYSEAKNKHTQQIAKKEAKSQTFQIADPYKGMGDLIGWLDTGITDDPSGKRGEATVRDTVDTLEVLVVQKRNMEYYILPWLAEFNGQKIPADTPPVRDLARAIAECSIQLPRELCWNLDKTIGELESISLQYLRAWQQSDWLKGELFLILDEQLNAKLCGYHLHYDQNYGLLAKKIEEENVHAGKSI